MSEKQENTFSQVINDNGKGNQVASNSGHVGDNINSTGIPSPTQDIFGPIVSALKDAGANWKDPHPQYATPAVMVGEKQAQADIEVHRTRGQTAGKNLDDFNIKVEKESSSWKDITPWILDGTIKVSSAVLDSVVDKSPTVAGLKALIEFLNNK